MSVTHKRTGAGAEGLEAFRASILAEVEAKNAETEESIISRIRENLVSIPVAGEEWNSRKSYIAGDWALTPTEEEIGAWADIEDGTVIVEGTTVTYDGKTWVCTKQHIKSTVYRPKAISTKWEEVS